MLTGEFWADQSLFTVGLGVDESMRVLGRSGDAPHENLLAAGSVLAGATRWSEKSGEGIAAGSAFRATQTVLGEA